jgi:hypothetical protein
MYYGRAMFVSVANCVRDDVTVLIDSVEATPLVALGLLKNRNPVQRNITL